MRISRINLLGCVALTLSWLGYDHYRPWVNFHSEGLAMAGLSLLLLAQWAKAFGPWVVPRMGLWIGVAAGLPWLQYLIGLDLFAGDAVMVSLYLLGLLGAVAVGYGSLMSAAATPARLHIALLHGLWVAALVSAAIGLAQWLMVQDGLAMYAVQTDVGDRAMGNLGQPNQLATLLLMGMMALTYVYQQKIIGRLGWVIAMVFMTLVLVMTGSRAGMLGVLVLAAFLIWKSRREKLGITTGDIVVWVLGYVLGNLMLPYLAELLLMEGGRSIESLTHTNDRWVIWQQIVHGIFTAPWVGYGWNQTATAQMVGALLVPGDQPVTYAHNFVLDMLVWNGLPLGLLFTGAIAYWVVTRMARVRGATGVYAMAGLLPLMVHSMVEYPFAYAYFLLMAGFLIGMVEACTPGGRVIQLNIWVSRSVLMVWMVVGSYLTVEYFLIEEDFRVVRFQNLKIGQTPADYEKPKVWMLSHMAALLRALRLQPEPGMNSQALEELRHVARRFPIGPVNLRYALALGLNGDPAGATLEMRVIRGMYGEAYYQAAKSVLREIEKEKYPQLSAIELS